MKLLTGTERLPAAEPGTERCSVNEIPLLGSAGPVSPVLLPIPSRWLGQWPRGTFLLLSLQVPGCSQPGGAVSDGTWDIPGTQVPGQGQPHRLCAQVWRWVKRAAVQENLSVFITWIRASWQGNRSQPFL